ncbi:MAG: FHA domain-containing protein [Pseudomonadota bacterium]
MGIKGNVKKRREWRRFLGGALMAAAFAGPSFSQDEATSKYPVEGIAILDCDPGAPAPEDSCLVQLPPLMTRAGLQTQGAADFSFVRPGSPEFPDDVVMSGSIVLIDTTPGQGGARRGTFTQERSLIKSFVESLPRGEKIALYGFSDTITRLTDFTTDRAVLAKAVDELELDGDNTRIRSSVLDAIDVLKERNDVLMKNIILITDGDEEGFSGATEISTAAIEAGVPISVLGVEWRAIGVSRTAQAEDYLESITDATQGETVMVRVRRFDEATQQATEFGEQIRSARRGSGLILPKGEAKAATIFVTLKEPLPGGTGERSREVRVQFTPANPPEPEPEPVDPNEGKIFGFDPMIVYTAAAILGILLLALLFFLLTRGKKEDEEEEFEPIDIEPVAAAEVTAVGADPDASTKMVAPKQRPIAYLIEGGGTKQHPVTGARTAIGRGKSNSVVVNHDSISRVHAELHRNRDGGFSITDMDSLNGTFINGSRIKGTQAVRAGDKISFGEVETKLVLA